MTAAQTRSTIPTVAVVVITYNESHNIQACLRSASWADERIVVDSLSTDDTVDKAQGLATLIVTHPWEGYSGQKNFAASLAKSEWIFVAAADERITPALAEEVRAFITQATVHVAAARLPIRDWMFGKFIEHGSWSRQRHVRLHRAGRASWEGSVHEGLRVEGEIVDLKQPLLHYSHLTFGHFLKKLNIYTDLEAQEMFDRGQSIGLGRACLGAARAFLGQYVRLQGFRDGGHGLILALGMAFYFFTTRAKLWTLWYSKEHLRQ